MRLANLKGRATLITPGGAVDVEQGSQGRFGSDPQGIFAQWAAVRAWAAGVGHSGVPFVENDLACPVPRPAQVFGIGLNYRSHAAEAGLPVPERPAVFTKFPTCLTGPFAEVVLPSACVDWEVELVVVMGIEAYRVEARDAWRHIAGLTVGQDLSERVVQWGGGGQFSLGKSFPGFGPMGPCADHAGRARRSGRPRDRLPREWRGDAAESHGRYGLQRAATRRRVISDPAALAGGRDLHGHARWGRGDPATTALSAARGRADQPHRGHRYAAESLRCGSVSA